MKDSRIVTAASSLPRLRSRTLVAIALCLVVLCCLAAPSRAEESNLLIGTEEWPPYEYSGPAGRLTGLSTEIMRAVLDRMGASVQDLSSYPWARGLKLLEGGRLDVLYSAVFDRERQLYARYPKTPLFTTQWIFFIRSEDVGRLRFRSFVDLENGGVGVVHGYSYTPKFNLFIKNSDKVVSVSDNRANLELLTRGRVDYALFEYVNGMHLLEQTGMTDEVVPLVGEPLGVIRLYPLFNRATVSEAFVDRFDRELADFKARPAYWKIVNRYLY